MDYSVRSFDVLCSYTVSIKGWRLVTSSNSAHVHLPVEVDLIQELTVVEENNLLVELNHLLSCNFQL